MKKLFLFFISLFLIIFHCLGNDGIPDWSSFKYGYEKEKRFNSFWKKENSPKKSVEFFKSIFGKILPEKILQSLDYQQLYDLSKPVPKELTDFLEEKLSSPIVDLGPIEKESNIEKTKELIVLAWFYYTRTSDSRYLRNATIFIRGTEVDPVIPFRFYGDPALIKIWLETDSYYLARINNFLLLNNGKKPAGLILKPFRCFPNPESRYFLQSQINAEKPVSEAIKKHLVNFPFIHMVIVNNNKVDPENIIYYYELFIKGTGTEKPFFAKLVQNVADRKTLIDFSVHLSEENKKIFEEMLKK